MKFQKRLEEEAPALWVSESFRQSMVKYKILKKHIKAMNPETIHQRVCDRVDGDCCICFEPFQVASRRITTACGHDFHPFCLIASLGTEACSSCPLCRRTAAGLVPSGLDGDLLRFMAMVRVNAKAVQSSFENALRYLEGAFDRHQTQAANLNYGRPLEIHQLARTVADTLAVLDATIKFGALNYEGFRKILKKFDKRTGCGASAQMLPDLQRMGFVADRAVIGTDRCAELRASMHLLLCDLHVAALQLFG
jgi:hypothetical protein